MRVHDPQTLAASTVRGLTLQEHKRKSNGKVPSVLASFYAQWRVRCGVVPVLREDRDSPPERLLQTIWQHQRLLREQLKTLDGQPVRILHPGFRSVEGGPDFRGRDRADRRRAAADRRRGGGPSFQRLARARP